MKLVSTLVVIIILLCAASSFVNVVEGRLSLFKADVTIVDLDLNNTANTRTYGATIYYRDDKAISGTTERIRTDVFLASSGQTLTFLEIYEKIWGRYTLCSGGCNYQDIFPDELPRLWVDPADTSSRVDQGSYYEYSFDHTDGSDFVTLRTSKTTFEPISADILLHISSVDGTTRSILKRSITFNTFNQSNGAVPSGALNVPVNCPTINHGCSRLDMIIILDNTGSIGLGWYDELTFATNIINNFFMSPQLVQIGLIKFKTEAFTIYPLTSDKNLLFQALNLQNTSNNGGSGQTSQVSAMAAALDMFENFGRPATSRAVMIISDGVGNRPCAGSPYTNYTGPFCGTLNPLASYFSAGELLAGCNNDLDGTGTINGCTDTNLGAQNGACCEAVHRILLQQFYASSRWTQATNNGVPITIYAIAVAGKDSFSDDILLELADNQAKNIYRVTSFGDLNTLTDKIAVQLVNADCSVPTPSVCPYDCLPGGFCCGSACVCITDCSTLNNDCQVGFCASSDSGTGCTRTTPNDLLCQDGNACVNRTCVAGVGCNTQILTNVVNCSDHNPCTVNDTCTATGQCNGTIDDSQSCTIDVCTYAQCVSGVCTKTGEFKCPDTNPNDCVFFPCTVRNGEITCPSKVAPDGRNCSTGSPTSDPCVVDVCVSGTCERGRIENNSTCLAGSGDGDGVDAETIGLAVGIPVGVFLLLLCLILILVVLAALLFLTRDSWVPSNGGLLNAFSSARSVKNNPDFKDNIGMTNLAYDRG